MSNKQLIKEIILERNPNALFLEDMFNDAIVGSANPCGGKYVALYDSDRCIGILVEEQNMSEVEAHEQFQHTSEKSSYSENKPVLFSDFRNISIPDFSNFNEDSNLKDIL